MNKKFDAVGWMRKRRTEIDCEDGGLSPAEKSKKTMKLLQSDPIWRRLKKRAVRVRSLKSYGRTPKSC